VEYRAVFFDAGETLLHPHPSFPELLTTVLRGQGHDVDQDVVRDRLWVVSERFLKASKENELWSTSAERSRAFWSSIYEVFLGELGIEWTEALAHVLYSTFTDISNYRLFPEAIDVLEELHRGGTQLGLISNFEKWLDRLLEVLDIARFFDVRVISGVEGLEKPDPKIFLVALERAGVEPSDAVYVGDNVHFDIDPAEEVGMTGVLIDRRGRYPDHDGFRIASLAELPGVLGR
jgi:putative hydrolase of the HAD superfamily